jgi:hypothetical protein
VEIAVPEVSRTCDVAWPHAWAALARYEHWPSWGPSITDVDPPAGEVGVGDRGRVRTPVGGWLPFEVTAVDPGRRWDWRVAGVPATGHRVDALGATRSRIVIEVPWWAAPYVVVCRVALARLEEVAEALAADA